MNNIFTKTALLLGALFVIAACDGKKDDVSRALTSETANDSVGMQIVKSSDGAVVLTVDPDFSDKLKDAAFLAGEHRGEVELLQYDSVRNLTVTVVKGGLKNNFAELFSSLEKNLKSDPVLKDIRIDEMTEHSMSYRFTVMGNNQTAYHESCITIANLNTADKPVYTVCANSSDMDGENLNAWLMSNVRFSFE